MSYLCKRGFGWYIHSVLVFKTQRSTDELSTGHATVAFPQTRTHPPTLPKPQPISSSIPTQAVDGNSFAIMPFNANGIRNKLTSLGEFLERHNVKVTVIQQSKLSSNSKPPSINNFTTVRKDRCQCQGGGSLSLIHKSINFSRKPESSETLVEPHLEELTITATLGNTE